MTHFRLVCHPEVVQKKIRSAQLLKFEVEKSKLLFAALPAPLTTQRDVLEIAEIASQHTTISY